MKLYEVDICKNGYVIKILKSLFWVDVKMGIWRINFIDGLWWYVLKFYSVVFFIDCR